MQDILMITSGLSFLGIGVYTFATMFYIFRRFGVKSCFTGFPNTVDSKAVLQTIPPWVKRLGLCSAIVFASSLVLLTIIFEI